MNNNLSNVNTFELDNLDLSPEQILSYWTPERKKNAIAIDTLFEPEVGLVEGENASTTEPKQADLSKRPFEAGGKLFFTLDNKDFVGSASIVGQNNIVLTAAHCVQDSKTGDIAENFLFSRCFTGELSSEDIAFKKIVLKQNWVKEKSRRWDYAFAILSKNSNVSKPLQYATNVDLINKTVNAFGYPGNFFEGAQMVFINGTVSKSGNNLWRLPGNRMLTGCSGGPWVLEDNETVVGLNGASTTLKTPNVLLSPIFDSEFDNLYQYTVSLAKESE